MGSEYAAVQTRTHGPPSEGPHKALLDFSGKWFRMKKFAYGKLSDEYNTIVSSAQNHEQERELHGIARENIKARRRIGSAQYGSCVISGLAMGQGVGYILQFGGDQLGPGMSSYWRIGGGWLVAENLADVIPGSREVGVALKATEIVVDFSRAYFENKVLKRRGYVADVIPTAMGIKYGQPVWSTLEAVHKTGDAFLNPGLIGTPVQIVYSLGNIINSIARYVIDVVIWFKGDWLQKKVKEKVTDRIFANVVKRGKERLKQNEDELKRVLGERAQGVIEEVNSKAREYTLQ